MNPDPGSPAPEKPEDSDERREAAAEAAEGPPVSSQDADILALVGNEPHVVLNGGQVLFAEGDPPNAMYVVKSGTLRIQSGGVVYEDVGPGGIVGEMALVEKHHARSATVYALTDCELVAVDEARFAALVVEAPSFAITVMQVLSRRLRVMDRRYRPEQWNAREPLDL
jgi:CRP/FNR family cyclic AMP-dependent transcriptional regulator